jgi:hypothetical protein
MSTGSEMRIKAFELSKAKANIKIYASIHRRIKHIYFFKFNFAFTSEAYLLRGMANLIIKLKHRHIGLEAW